MSNFSKKAEAAESKFRKTERSSKTHTEGLFLMSEKPSVIDQARKALGGKTQEGSITTTLMSREPLPSRGTESGSGHNPENDPQPSEAYAASVEANVACLIFLDLVGPFFPFLSAYAAGRFFRAFRKSENGVFRNIHGLFGAITTGIGVMWLGHGLITLAAAASLPYLAACVLVGGLMSLSFYAGLKLKSPLAPLFRMFDSE